MPSDRLDIVYCTFPDADGAERVARQLVDEGLTACAQLMPPIKSLFRWDGAVQSADETPLLCKTGAGQGAALAARIVELHPYDLPAVAHWPAECSPDLAAWAAGRGET